MTETKIIGDDFSPEQRAIIDAAQETLREIKDRAERQKERSRLLRSVHSLIETSEREVLEKIIELHGNHREMVDGDL